MTRDQAYDIAKVYWGNGAMEAIDAWVKLGMLKLDKPKSAHQRMVEACCNIELTCPTIDRLCDALEAAGLEVVEAKP